MELVKEEEIVLYMQIKRNAIQSFVGT